MSTQAKPIFTPPTSVVRSTVGKGNEETQENLNRPASDAALREYCDKHYHQLLPLIAEKVHQGKAHQDKLKEVKARLNFGGHVKEAPEFMRISGFMHRITKPELIKRLHDKIPKLVDEMIRETTTFLRGEVTASNQARKKTLLAWKQQDTRVAKQRVTQSFSPDLEISFPPLGDEDGTEDLMIIEAEISGYFIHRIYVDEGSASEILYGHCFNRLRPEVKSQMVPATAPLIGSSGKIIWPIGQISLSVKIGDTEHSTSTWMNFVVVRLPSPYNGIIGRPGVRKIQTVPSTTHGMLKFLVSGGLLTPRSSNIIPLECTLVLGPKVQPSANTRVTKERIKVAIHSDYLEQIIAIDMIGVSRHIVEHRLSVHKGCPSGKQKKISQAPERNKAIQEEVEGLVEANIMKEFEECRSNLPTFSRQSIPEINWHKLGGIRGRFGNQEPHRTRNNKDIKETIKTLRKINMKLNPKKCTFGVEEGMFLGYMVNTKGIKVCRDKVEGVLSLPSLKCLKDVQMLNGKLASLNKFLAKSAEKSLPFFKTLKKCTKKSNFQWNAEAESTFKQMKKLIAELPTLTAPMEKEELIVYLAATREAVSTVLMTEKEAKQMPIYFVSRALQGRLRKWSIELGEYDIHYRPRVSIKGQILEDFIMERLEDDSLAAPLEVEEELLDPRTLFINRSYCVDGFGSGLILTNPKGTKFTYALRFKFNATNNEAEYEALIAGLRITEQIRIKTFKHM
nr:reverse transcriptase domain-containing protein [Tanacetum cinerariifolium]